MTWNRFLLKNVLHEIQMFFPPGVVWNTNIPVPTLTYIHVLWRIPKLCSKVYKWLLSTSDYPFKSVQLFNVCKPPTHLAYLPDLKQLGGQSILSCMKTKIKRIGYFKCKAKMLGGGEWKRREGGLTRGQRGESVTATILSGRPSFTLVSFAFVIFPRPALTGTKNRISHWCLNSLHLGSPKQNQLEWKKLRFPRVFIS